MVKAEIELVINSNGVKFLNYWNYINGDDVTCEIVDDKLILTEFDENSIETEREITFFEFVKMVEEREAQNGLQEN